jgi:hypothetical protein
MLFELMVGAALGAQVACARAAALIERRRVVQVAPVGWPSA